MGVNLKINLNLLPIKLDNDVVIPENYYENTDIKRLDDIHVKGLIDYDLSENVRIQLQITGKMILNDSITLDNIEEDINIDIDETLDEIASESTYFYEKDKNILDIIEFLWENIVLEVPISRTLVSGTNLDGKGWSLNKVDGEEKIDERFLKLNDYFKGGE